MTTPVAPLHREGTGQRRGAAYDHETLSRLLSPADPLHAAFLRNLQRIESLEARLGAPDWTDEHHEQLIHACHQIRNQLCCLMVAQEMRCAERGATPQSRSILEALGRVANLFKGDRLNPPRPDAD